MSDTASGAHAMPVEPDVNSTGCSSKKGPLSFFTEIFLKDILWKSAVYHQQCHLCHIGDAACNKDGVEEEKALVPCDSGREECPWLPEASSDTSSQVPPPNTYSSTGGMGYGEEPSNASQSVNGESKE